MRTSSIHFSGTVALLDRGLANTMHQAYPHSSTFNQAQKVFFVQNPNTDSGPDKLQGYQRMSNIARDVPHIAGPANLTPDQMTKIAPKIQGILKKFV